jgi:putative transposase
MSSHVHLIISTETDNLSGIIGDMKRHTSKTILQAIENNIQESRRDWMLWLFKRAGEYNSNNEKYQFWQQNNHPIQLSTQIMINQRLDYLHYNRVEAGIVSYPPEYLYSSAKAYYTEEEGLLPVILLS